MIPIAKRDWDEVHEIACQSANATGADDHVMAAAKSEALMVVLEAKYGPRSIVTATKADVIDDETSRLRLYEEALRQAQAENDFENEKLILQSLQEIEGDRTP